MSLLILDFDSTLFNTTAFLDEFWPKVEKNSGVELDSIAKANSQLNRYAKDWEGYLRDKGVAQGVIDQTFTEIEGSYLYDDILSQLPRLAQSYELRIMTSGFDDWQNAKLQLSGILDHISATVVLGNKGEIIKREIENHKDQYKLLSQSEQSHDEVLLADDKPEVLEPLKGHKAVRLFLVDRHQRHADKKQSDWYSYIESLKEIT
jgi:phosphoserine phosphatase